MSEESPVRYLSLLYRYFQIYLSEELLPYHIGKGQALFLLFLYRFEGVTQDEMACYLHIDKSTAARALEKLKEAGYVKKVPKKDDLRSNQLFLTPQAWEIEPRLQEVLRRWSDILGTDMTEEEFALATGLLKKMTENAIDHIRDVKQIKTFPGSGMKVKGEGDQG